MLLVTSRRRHRPHISSPGGGGGYTALKSADWSTFADTAAVLAEWDGSADRLVGDYFASYANHGFTKAEMYALMGGTPWPGGKGLRMCHPCGNELSTPDAGPETGGPHQSQNWAVTTTGPGGLLRWTLGAAYGETIYRLKYRLSDTSDRPANGISNGWTDNHDQPVANGHAQKMHWLQYNGGVNVGTGGFRTEIVNGQHRVTTNFSSSNWAETPTRWGLSTGSRVTDIPNPMAADPTNHLDGYLDTFLWFKRVSATECYHIAALNAEFDRSGASLSASWNVYRQNSVRLASPTASPNGINQCQSHQNRNGRVSPGTQYTILGPTEVIVGAYDCAAFFDAVGAPGYVP